MPSATDTLINDARCIEDCIPGSDMKLAVLISLFAQIAGVSANTDSLIAGAKCIQPCIPGTDMKLAVLISLAQQIVAAGASSYFIAEKNGGAQSIPDNTITDLVWQVTTSVPSGSFAANVWTAPKDGLVLFTAEVFFEDIAGRMEAFLHCTNRHLNTYPTDGGAGCYGPGGDEDGAFTGKTVVLSYFIPVLAGDKFALSVLQISGGAINVIGIAQATFFHGIYVG